VRFCANENLSEETILRLRRDGHDVVWIRELAPGIADHEVLARARADDRVLLTFDKDFGELVYHLGSAASRGIILFRISQLSAASVAERISKILASRTDWEGHFSVVDDAVVRMRGFPAT